MCCFLGGKKKSPTPETYNSRMCCYNILISKKNLESVRTGLVGKK